MGFFILSGAGGSRTLVQTSNYNAFFMLSFRLDFREVPDRKPPNTTLASLVLRDYRSLNLSMLLLMVFRIETPTTRASQEHLASLPCKDVAKSYYDSD